jgi:anti-sigma factor RsiW
MAAPELPARARPQEPRPQEPRPQEPRPKPAKPDPRPMRAALAAAGLAAFSAVAAGIVMPPQIASTTVVPPADAAQAQPADAAPIATYVQLLPGQTPPPGATVIPFGGSTGGNATAAPVKPKPTPIIIKTTQSGKTVK